MKLRKRYIHPGDNEKTTKVPLSITEMKILQGMLLDEAENIKVLPNQQLAEKLEYYIQEYEV